MNIIARIDQAAYKPQMDYLITQHSFNDMSLYHKRSKTLKGSSEMLVDLINYTKYIFKNFKIFQQSDTLIALGWLPIIFRVLIKLRMISCRRFFWMSFMLHNPKLFPFFKWLLKATSVKGEYYIVNTAFDAMLYADKLGIDPEKIKVLPYGDWKDLAVKEPQKGRDDNEYYFAGGYTDRDYKSLIAAFTKLDKKLVIVGSHLNVDLNITPPANVEILKDIKRDHFHKLVKEAKACILPMKQATGASGHMVLLNYMKEGKAIIATNVPGIKEYVDRDKSAILIDNIIEEVPQVVMKIERNPEMISRLGIGAMNHYRKNFGKESLSRKLEEIIA